MNAHGQHEISVGMVARLILCTLAAGILPTQALRAHVEAQGSGSSTEGMVTEQASVAEEVFFLPLVIWDVQATVRVSISSDGLQGNYESYDPSISADGRFVAFYSGATNLVDGAGGGIFVHDRHTKTTGLVSEGVNDPAISADGRYVGFTSYASDLVDGDTKLWTDVFVHDRQTGVTELVSLASDGTQGNSSSNAPSISADGRYVAFLSYADNLVEGDTNAYIDVFVHDRQTGATERVSVDSNGAQAYRDSTEAAISYDGRYVAFVSLASFLVDGDTNGSDDVFVHDRQTRVTERVSVAGDSTQGNYGSYHPSISSDGRYVAFWSDATNLVSDDINNFCDTDWDGVFDDNCTDVFVHDRQTGETMRVSVATDGTQGNGHSGGVSISGDGRYVAFLSNADNLVGDDTNNFCDTDYDYRFEDNCTDVFVHDRQTGVTELVSVASDGTQGNNGSSSPSISTDGSYVAFVSAANNLVEGDTNGFMDVFVRWRNGSR